MLFRKQKNPPGTARKPDGVLRICMFESGFLFLQVCGESHEQELFVVGNVLPTRFVMCGGGESHITILIYQNINGLSMRSPIAAVVSVCFAHHFGGVKPNVGH